MSRKDYVAIAGVVATIVNSAERERIALAVARIMQADNPAFRPGKFLSACKVMVEVRS